MDKRENWTDQNQFVMMMMVTILVVSIQLDSTGLALDGKEEEEKGLIQATGGLDKELIRVVALKHQPFLLLHCARPKTLKILVNVNFGIRIAL